MKIYEYSRLLQYKLLITGTLLICHLQQALTRKLHVELFKTKFTRTSKI